MTAHPVDQNPPDALPSRPRDNVLNHSLYNNLTTTTITFRKGHPMGVELTLLGVRKLRGDELAALAGKPRLEMSGSTLHEQLFQTETFARYELFDPEQLTNPDDPRNDPAYPNYSDIMPMLSPIRDADGKTVYICWMETLADYWHADPYDRDKIEMFFDDMGWAAMESDQAYQRVPYDIAEGYFKDEPLFTDESIEVIVMSFS